jgi:hypothetical protein
LAEAFLTHALGETRVAIVEDGELVEMRIDRVGDGLAAGAIVRARLTARAGVRGFADAAGETLLVEPWPAGATEGAEAVLEVCRAAWREPGRDRLAKARPAPGATAAPPIPLDARLAAAGYRVRRTWPDTIADRWAEAFEAATLGRFAFASGALLFTPTAAFTAVDVDGAEPNPVEALRALARAVRLWGLGGSVVIDLPAASRADRQAAAAALDRSLAGWSFERTAVNGFGLLQLVLPRTGPSILERARLERAATAAIALLEAAAREPRPGRLCLVASPPVARWLDRQPDLVAALARQTGRAVDVIADPMAGEGHVETSP